MPHVCVEKGEIDRKHRLQCLTNENDACKQSPIYSIESSRSSPVPPIDTSRPQRERELDSTKPHPIDSLTLALSLSQHQTSPQETARHSYSYIAPSPSNRPRRRAATNNQPSSWLQSSAVTVTIPSSPRTQPHQTAAVCYRPKIVGCVGASRRAVTATATGSYRQVR